MTVLEAIRVAFEGVTANKLRAVLTTLGVVIGVGAVVALVSVSQGASALITGQIEALGTNLVVITPRTARVAITTAHASMLAERVGSLAGVAPSLSVRTRVRWGLNTHDTTIEGVTPEYPVVRNYHVTTGRFINDGDIALRRPVAVVGHRVAVDLFMNRNPVGEELVISGHPFTVVGVLEEKGESFVQEQDNLVMIPITVAQRLAGTTHLTAIYAQASAPELAATTVAQIQRIFERHFGRADQVRVQSQDELLGTVGDMTATVSLMLGAIAGISLVVGGIGIMNIMLVSVTERTKEIGIRRAVGARRSDVLRQFLAEALALSMIGGLIGLVGSTGLTYIVYWTVPKFDMRAPIWIMIPAFVISGMTGIIFGVWPARKASRIETIEALRFE